MPAATLDEIQAIATRVQRGMPVMTMQCTDASHFIAEDIVDELQIPARVARGTVVDGQGRSAGHAWVEIPGQYVEGASGTLIVDVTLSQFTRDNFEQDERVGASFGPSGSVPEVVITDGSDEWGSVYSRSGTLTSFDGPASGVH